MNKKEYRKKYYLKNKKKINEINKLYYLNNSERIKILRKVHDIKYRLKNKERIKESSRLYRLNNKDKVNKINKLYRLNNNEKFKQIHRLYRLNNKQKIKKYFIKYSLKNRNLLNGNEAKRRAMKLKATPKFANLNKIREIYKNCPKGYHVDHIIPLKGKTVCGLHVEWNLQYLTEHDNRSKSNKLIC